MYVVGAEEKGLTHCRILSSVHMYAYSWTTFTNRVLHNGYQYLEGILLEGILFQII